MTSPHPLPPAGQPPVSHTKRTVALLAGLAVAILIASMLIVRFAAGGEGSTDTPTGLSASLKDSGVVIAWTGVDGADSYEVVRDGATIVYAGSATTTTDNTAPEGTRTYTVRAVSNGVVSAPSAASEVAVGAAWGQFAPFIEQLPKVLPKRPDATGWKDITCTPELSAFDDEVSPEEKGSGKIYTKARVYCNGPQIAVNVVWATSKEALDAIFLAASKRRDASAIKWRYGTGYISDDGTVAYLRPDNLDNVSIALAADKATRESLLAAANSLPLE